MQPDNNTEPDQNTKPQQPSNTPAPDYPQTAEPVPADQQASGGAANSDPFKSDPAPVSGGVKPKRKIPAALLIVGLAVLLLGGGAAAYFTTIVANKPENIWAKAMDNTNRGYDKLVEYSKANQDVKGLSIDGNFKMDSAGIVVDGTIKGKSYDKDADLTIDIGAAGTRVNISTLSHVPENSAYPDVYIKATGLKGIGQMLGSSEPEVGNMLAAFDNQWYAIDHTLFETLEKQSGSSNSATAANLTPEDVHAILESVGRVNEQYLFTDDKNNAVLTVAESVGKESLDGRSTHHFKVGYNKENLKKYATAMKDELNKTKVKELVPEKDLEKALDFENMLKEIDKLDGKGTADVWVDLDTKLIRKVRFTDEENKEAYLDFMLNYDGGDNYPFLIKVHDKEDGAETDLTFGINFNTKQNTSEITLDIKVGGPEPVNGNAKIRLAQSEEKIDFKKPEGAKSLSDLLGGLMGGQLPIGNDVEDLQGLDQLQL